MALISASNTNTKLILTLTGIGMLFLFAWFFAFSKTLQAYSDLKAQEALLSQVATAPETIHALEQELTHYQSGVNQTTIDRNLIFREITEFCDANNLKLLEFEEEETVIYDDVQYTTHPILFQGSYEEMVKLLYYIEYEKALGKIRHVNFHVSSRKPGKPQYLQMYCHLQTITTIK